MEVYLQQATSRRKKWSGLWLFNGEESRRHYLSVVCAALCSLLSVYSPAYSSQPLAESTLPCPALTMPAAGCVTAASPAPQQQHGSWRPARRPAPSPTDSLTACLQVWCVPG